MRSLSRGASALLVLILVVPGLHAAQAAETTFSGVFQVIYGDSIDFTSGTQIYVLTEADGTNHDLQAPPTAFGSTNPNSLQGEQVRVAGVEAADGTIEATNVEPSDQAAASGFEAALTGSTPWAVLTCKYSGIATETNPLSYYTSMMDGTYPRLDNYWKSQSYNLINLTGTTAYGWFTLPQTQAYYTNTANSDSVNLTNLANDCTAVATASVNFATFFGVTIMVNGTVTGGAVAWGGNRNMTLDGVTKSWPFAWMSSTAHRVGVTAHEMGHGYGLTHSSALPYAGPNDDYHSDWDVMSSGFWSESSTYAPYTSQGTGTNAYNKDRLGWIPPSRKFTPAAGSSTTITLWPLGDAAPTGSQHQMAQIPIGSTTHFYTVEARQKRIGTPYYDIGVPAKGVVLHEVNPDTGVTGRNAPSLVVDGDTNYVEFPDPGEVWVPGETFIDTPNQVSVQVLSENADGSYSVKINFKVAGVTLTQSGGSTQVTEGGATDTYTVVLNSQPTANVTVTPTHGASQVTLSGPVTFTNLNWNVAQTITVTAVDDATAEASPHTALITHTAASGDPLYNNVPVGSITANVIDNEPGVLVAETAGATTVTEGGATDTYTVVLRTQPTASVAITPANAAGEVSLSPSPLTFTTSNWSTAQTVTVTAVNDAIDEPSPESTTITHTASSSDPAYNAVAGPTIIASVVDNDAAGVTIVQSGGGTQVKEGGFTDTYTIVLDTQPTASVTVTPAHAGGQVTMTGGPATFTTANWNVAKTITVTAVDDTTVEASPHTALITHSSSSTDAFYNGIPVASVAAGVLDNEAGLIFTETSGGTAVTEGGATDTYTVRLLSAPTANVVVTPIGLGEVSFSPSSLTFTSANFATAQTLTATAVNDEVDEPSPEAVTVSHSTSSADPNYNGLTGQTVLLNVIDNDVSGLTLTQTGGSTAVTEGGLSDSYTIALTSRPTANVVISTAVDNGQVTVGATLTFTPTGPLAQSLAVLAVNDAFDEPLTMTSVITHTLSSTDPNYVPIIVPSVTVTVTDNDVAGVTLTQTGTSTDVTEGGASDTYTIRLASQPTADVTVTLTPNSQVTASPGSVTFTGSDYTTPKTITVGAFDDTLEEAPVHPGQITHSVSSLDSYYNGLPVPAVSVNVTDNDDRTAPVSTFVTRGGSIVLASQSVTGNTTDAAAGVDRVDLRFGSLLGTRIVGTQLTCNTGRTSCAWSYIIPTSFTPGIYTVKAEGRDRAGNIETNGPIITIYIV